MIEVSSDATRPMSYPGLTQVVAFQDHIVSGAKPDGVNGFESLMKMDVSVIICVDGVTPDVKTAHHYGIKTIHVPLKYGAPSNEQIFDLATISSRVTRGNIYIHCHQGKHRSAAAAAIVSIALGSMTVDEAKARMLVSQTSPEYKGLWESVQYMDVIDVFDLMCNEKQYPSTVVPEGIASQMIAIDEAMDNVTRIQEANWAAPTSHPDLIGAAEVGVIADLFRKMHVSQEASQFPVDFETQLVNAIHQASGLEEALLENVPRHELDEYMQRVEQTCISCHAMFRK